MADWSLTRRPGECMCCICFEWTPVDELYVDDAGDVWDVCRRAECVEQVRPLSDAEAGRGHAT
jgi:hypothetical protein